MGTGTYGSGNPTVITCGFKPKMVLIYQSRTITYNKYSIDGGAPAYIPTAGISAWGISFAELYFGSQPNKPSEPFLFNILTGPDDKEFVICYYYSSFSQAHMYITMKTNATDTGIAFYCKGYYGKTDTAVDIRTAKMQYNDSGTTYQYVAIG